MYLKGFSQVPVLSGRTVRGAVTYESIAIALQRDPHASLRDAVMQPRVHTEQTHLLEVLTDIDRDGFIIVKDRTERPVAVVTGSDVVNAFGDLATPFGLIGDLDRRLRSVLDDALEWEQLLQHLDADGTRHLDSVDSLSFGDYTRAFSSTEIWDQLGWSCDRKAFLRSLEIIRIIRNDIFHFNPDPLPPGAIDLLVRMNRLIDRQRGV